MNKTNTKLMYEFIERFVSMGQKSPWSHIEHQLRSSTFIYIYWNEKRIDLVLRSEEVTWACYADDVLKSLNPNLEKYSYKTYGYPSEVTYYFKDADQCKELLVDVFKALDLEQQKAVQNHSHDLEPLNAAIKTINDKWMDNTLSRYIPVKMWGNRTFYIDMLTGNVRRDTDEGEILRDHIFNMAYSDGLISEDEYEYFYDYAEIEWDIQSFIKRRAVELLPEGKRNWCSGLFTETNEYLFENKLNNSLIKYLSFMNEYHNRSFKSMLTFMGAKISFQTIYNLKEASEGWSTNVPEIETTESFGYYALTEIIVCCFHDGNRNIYEQFKLFCINEGVIISSRYEFIWLLITFWFKFYNH